MQYLSPAEFLQVARNAPVIDVRSPGEFAKGHIPGAVSLPLFDDEERAIVGRLYKNQGREPAIQKGLEIVGPKIGEMVAKVRELAVEKRLNVHCWRGGMRSESVAQLLNTAGFEVNVLQGGYKGFRQFSREVFGRPWKIVILAGMTGCGKTEILHELRNLGEQIIDLEAVARHKGSTFGHLGEAEQPSVEHFHNELVFPFLELDPERRVWIEDESYAIGRVYVPDPLWESMLKAPAVRLDMSRELRATRLAREYGNFDPEIVADRIRRISKRLGGQRASEALEAVERGDAKAVALLTLHYYDKAYTHLLENRPAENVAGLAVTEDAPAITARTLAKMTIPGK